MASLSFDCEFKFKSIWAASGLGGEPAMIAAALVLKYNRVQGRGED